jgi:hypothetical protein
MRTLYIDTEFTELSLDRRLISLALVDAQGHEFYVELLDGWDESHCSDFVREIVLPQLDLARCGMTRALANQALHGFLRDMGECEIAGDALAWDWPLLLELLAPGGLPDNVLGCRALLDEHTPALAEADLLDAAPHHALLDARLLCKVFGR